MAIDAKRHIVPYVVGLAPPLLVALSWSPSGDWSFPKPFMRGYSAPVVGSEIFVIIVALREGLLRALPRWGWTAPVALAFAVLLIVATATASLAPDRLIAVMLTTYWIIHVLFALSVFHLCGRAIAPRDLVRAYLAGFIIFAVEFFVFIHQIPDWSTFDWRNDFMAFTHIRHAGYYLAAMAGLGMGTMAVARGRGEWFWGWACAALAFGIALWTGSRGAALAVAGALVAGILLVPAMRSLRCWLGSLASMAVALAVVSVTPGAPSSLMGLARAVQQTAGGDVTTGRTTIWMNVIGAIRHNPLFGYGEGQMHRVAPYSTMGQPHDSILQVTLAWGLVGLACVIVLAVAFARRAIPAVRGEENRVIVPAFIAMTAIAILSLYDGALYYALPQSIFFACAALVASRWSAAGASPEATAARAPASA
jgi:O-antigen ligase